MFILHIYNSGMNYFIRSSLYRNITHTYITWKYYRNNKTFIFHPEWQDSQHITRLSFHKKSSVPFFFRSHDILIWTDLDVVQLLFSTRKVIKFYSFSQHWIISPQLQPYKISCARTFMIDLIGAIDKILRMVLAKTEEEVMLNILNYPFIIWYLSGLISIFWNIFM